MRTLKEVRESRLGYNPDGEIHLADFICECHCPLCIPYARIFQAEQKPAETTIAAQSSDECFGL
jgi:hypothetical protein